ncbi:transglycosylase SLT domain-containing protein [Nocardia nova]|uniref:transglycosylase SLT domain-containing protein n=1 Tax=Nocardia nova TaxID=37330 RepID=UPI0033F607F6
MSGPHEPDAPHTGGGAQAGIATTAPGSRDSRSKPAQAKPSRGAPRSPLATGATAATASGSAAQQPSGSGAPGPVASAAGGGSDMAMVAGAAGPLAMAAMSALNAMAGHYGGGSPTADTGQPTAPATLAGSGAPTGPIAWDSGVAGARYSAVQQGSSEAAGALGAVNSELRRILGGAVDDTMQGRAAMAAIIAEADAALTALGKVGNSAAAQQQVVSALDSALQRAGAVVGNGRAQSAVTAAQIDALAARYVRESGGGRPTRAYRSGGVSGGPPATRPSGAVGQWIHEAMQVLAQNGYDTSRIDPADVAAIIAHESAGDPHAINNWDSNAAKGTPSKGLMQCIDPTFDAHALPGHHDIWNPVDNIIAGIRYSIDRYGSVSDVPGIVGMRRGTGYVGY